MKKYFDACKYFKPLAQKLKNSGQPHPATVRKNDLKSPIWNGIKKIKFPQMTASESVRYEINGQAPIKRIFSDDIITRH